MIIINILLCFRKILNSSCILFNLKVKAMRNLNLIILSCLLLFCCNTQKLVFDKGKPYEKFRGFEPVDPTEYNQNVQIVLNDSTLGYKAIKLLTHDQIFSFLNNETVLVSIGKMTADGSFSYLPITLSIKNSSYKITMDYMKFATLGQYNSDEFIGLRRVGIGLRLISYITAFKSGINIGDLSSIGLAAKAEKLSGTLMIEVIGIKSKEVTTLLPLPSEINQSTIQTAMQALASIKSKIYDGDTKLFPQVMAIKVDSTGSDRITDSTKTKIIKGTSIEERKIKLQFEDNSISSTAESARKFESEAFRYLFERDVEKSIQKFDECERIYPSYHSVYDILKILRKEKQNLIDQKSDKWTEMYNQIKNQFSWKLSPEIIDGLNKSIKK